MVSGPIALRVRGNEGDSPGPVCSSITASVQRRFLLPLAGPQRSRSIDHRTRHCRGPHADTEYLAYGPGVQNDPVWWHWAARLRGLRGTARARMLGTSEAVSTLKPGPTSQHHRREREKKRRI
jgi:hypothetical protein